MTNRDQFRSSENRALELLPWYINDTLAGEERELVRRELLSSLTCRKEFERLRRLQGLMRSDDGESAATERAFERLLARIEAGTMPHRAHSSDLRRNTAWSTVARAAVLLVSACGIAWWWIHAGAPSPQTYATLSSKPAQAGIARVRVVFAPGISDESRRELLTEYRLTVVAPPTPEGIYTLAPDNAADLGRVVAALKADPRIEFATTPSAVENR